MALDPLADRLEVLLAEGSLVASELSRAMRARVSVLFELGVLAETKAGGGRRVVVQDEAALRAWISSAYPSGLSGVQGALPPRAESVANFADSKRGRSLAQRPVLMRGFGAATLHRESGTMPIGDLTSRHSVAAVLVERDAPWRLDGTLALVENFELFLHVERAVPGIDAALWYSGRVDRGLLDWIGGMPAVRVVHVADFDPVGLDEYLSAKAVLGERATLFVPQNLADLVARFGNAELLLRSRAVLDRIRMHKDEALHSVLRVLDVCGKGLEQEALLVTGERRGD
jgi:hypothetical protein